MAVRLLFHLRHAESEDQSRNGDVTGASSEHVNHDNNALTSMSHGQGAEGSLHANNNLAKFARDGAAPPTDFQFGDVANSAVHLKNNINSMAYSFSQENNMAQRFSQEINKMAPNFSQENNNMAGSFSQENNMAQSFSQKHNMAQSLSHESNNMAHSFSQENNNMAQSFSQENNNMAQSFSQENMVHSFNQENMAQSFSQEHYYMPVVSFNHDENHTSFSFNHSLGFAGTVVEEYILLYQNFTMGVTPGTGGELPGPQHWTYDVAKVMIKYVLPCIILSGLLGNLASFLVFLGRDLRKLSSSIYVIASLTSDTGVLINLLFVWLEVRFKV
jgi:hypothetical protein